MQQRPALSFGKKARLTVVALIAALVAILFAQSLFSTGSWKATTPNECNTPSMKA